MPSVLLQLVHLCRKSARLFHSNSIILLASKQSANVHTGRERIKEFISKATGKGYYLQGLLVFGVVGAGSVAFAFNWKWQWTVISKEFFKNFRLGSAEDVQDCSLALEVGIEDEWLTQSGAQSLNDLQKFCARFQSGEELKQNLKEAILPWEQSESDDPWLLLNLTQSSNFWVRQMGVASLANKTQWEDYKCRYIAQCCDPRTTVALARYPESKDTFFLPQPKFQPSKVPILSELKQLVSRMPVPDVLYSRLYYYRSLALQQEVKYKKDPLTMDVITEFSVLPGEEEKEKDKVIRFCLEALAAYTAMAPYVRNFIEERGLAVLQRLLMEYPQRWVQIYAVSILRNLSLVPDLLQQIVQSGWIKVLREWSRSNQMALSLMALTTLANLDRDWTTKDLYQDMVLLFPTQRNSQPVYADVVLVHGLRGGAVKTWRQRDNPDPHQMCNTTPCWPKDWLASDCSNIRIISIGYDSSLLRWGEQCPYEEDKRTLEGRGQEILKTLQQAGIGSRPIIWVGHSMGGLLIKEVLSLSHKEIEKSQLLAQTRGVVFFSVPHYGSTLVDIMMHARYLLFPSVEVQEMHTDSPRLRELQDEFLALMEKFSIPCLSFGENTKTAVGRPLPKLMIVAPESSDPGIGKFVSLPTDHINTCKPCGQEDQIYQLTLEFIRDILKHLTPWEL